MQSDERLIYGTNAKNINIRTNVAGLHCLSGPLAGKRGSSTYVCDVSRTSGQRCSNPVAVCRVTKVRVDRVGVLVRELLNLLLSSLHNGIISCHRLS